MAKNALKTALFSFFILLYCACSVPPTYSRKDIESAIKNLCKQEFNIDVKVREVGDTVWVYCPFEKIANDEGNAFREEISKKMDYIWLSLQRIVLSVDNRPKFYCFVASDISAGFDLYYVWYTQDLVMGATGFISRGDLQERQAYLYVRDSKAIGDIQGDHISKYDINLGEFISYLIRQNVEKKFTEKTLKDNFEVTDLHTKYYNGKLEIDFDIMIKKYKEDLPYPFDEAVAVTKKILKIYEYPAEIHEVTINDAFNKKSRLYTRRALMEDK